MFPFKTRTLKRHREELQLLPDDVVELILERLPVKSLLRFWTVSKKLKSAIDCRRFQERQQLIQMSRSGPHVLFVSLNCYDDDGRLSKREEDRSFVFGSTTSTAYTFRVPIAILDKHKLLLQGRDYPDAIVTLDLRTNSYDLLFKPTYSIVSFYYFESLFSA
ncbi:BnaC02g35180D [Brassica napus]|uniref:(rape) hypothetical protein n=1 Tax=Brassica napus TaxID=3708 RepID=A0A078I781_BRANA|nr:unnamed protein product [Brassica napus]CDY45716.1 BnaC02g35180D [Brassica napus]